MSDTASARKRPRFISGARYPLIGGSKASARVDNPPRRARNHRVVECVVIGCDHDDILLRDSCLIRHDALKTRAVIQRQSRHEGIGVCQIRAVLEQAGT